MLRSKRVNSKTTAGIADAIAARLNGQELTKTQRKRLSCAVTSDGVFRLQKPIKWPASKYNLEMIKQIYYDIDKEICSPLYGKAYSGEISFAEAEKLGR